jgi:hypothetical protein
MNDIEICIQFIKEEVNKKQLVQKSIEEFWKRFNRDKTENPDKYKRIFNDDPLPLIKIKENNYRSIAFVVGINDEADYIYNRFEIYYVAKIIKHKNETTVTKIKHIGIYQAYFGLDGTFMKNEMEIWFDMFGTVALV